MRQLLIAAVLALAACQTPAPAEAPYAAPPVQHATSAERNPAVQVDANIILAPPPGDAITALERDIVRGPWSEERRAQAREDNAIDPFAAFDSVLGPNFTPAQLPLTLALLDRAGRAAGFAGDPTKFLYQRPRPFLADAAIETCIPADERLRASYSYPSGHAALGWGWALILAELVPSQADAILVRGREFGESRVVCGVHYPSDIEAGRTVAAAAIARLHADPDFPAQIAAARAELEAAGIR